jgi:hypothetical protein
VLSTTSRTYDSSPARSLLPPSRRLAGAGLPAAATRLCRDVPLPARPDPNQAPESNLGESLVVFPTFPGRPRHRSRPIPASRAALHAGDYIASFSFFPGWFS